MARKSVWIVITSGQSSFIFDIEGLPSAVIAHIHDAINGRGPACDVDNLLVRQVALGINFGFSIGVQTDQEASCTLACDGMSEFQVSVAHTFRVSVRHAPVENTVLQVIADFVSVPALLPVSLDVYDVESADFTHPLGNVHDQASQLKVIIWRGRVLKVCIWLVVDVLRQDNLWLVPGLHNASKKRHLDIFDQSLLCS